MTSQPTNTPKLLRPWSVIDDEELTALRAIAGLARKLGRGCFCEYDYRCGNCQLIVDIDDLCDRIPK